jgi:GntR family transcriptional regulator
MPRPRYLEIADALRGQIDSGQLPPGAQLPTEAELREEYAASRNTIRDALRRLAFDHLVERRPGLGTFVAWAIDPLVNTIGPQGGEDPACFAEAAARHRRATASTPEVRVLAAGQPLASELSLHDDAEVVSRSQELYVDEVPWCVQTAFYRYDVVTLGAGRLMRAEHVSEGALAYLRNTLGMTARTWRATMLARPANDEEERFFGLHSDGRAAMVEIRKIFYADDTGSPFCVLLSAYPADRNRFRLTAGEVPDEGMRDA